MAANGGHKKIVEMLLEKGANVNCHLEDDCSALLRAVENDDKDIVEILLQN